MSSPLAMILVVLVIILGIGAVWAITGQGAATAPMQDSFGNTQPGPVINQSNQSAGLAVATMPVMYIAFFIAVCVVLVASVAWLWKTGKSQPGKY